MITCIEINVCTYLPVVAAADFVALVTMLRCKDNLEEGMMSSMAEVQLDAGTAGLLMVETVGVP